MGPLILLVDDDEYAVEILEEWLKGEGYRIITALEGEEALRLLEDHSPELILSDYVMPGMDGIAFLTRAKEVCPNAVRLITTGYGDLDMAIEAINDAGVYKFIPKPWNRNDLRLTVRRALEHQALLREMFECEKLVSLGRLAAGGCSRNHKPGQLHQKQTWKSSRTTSGRSGRRQRDFAGSCEPSRPRVRCRRRSFRKRRTFSDRKTWNS